MVSATLESKLEEVGLEGESLRVLVVCSTERECLRLRSRLANDSPTFDMQWTISCAAALTELRHRSHDACLFDSKLDDPTGVELFREAERRRVPIILLKNADETTRDWQATASNVTDVLDEAHLSGPLLERSIRYAVQHARLRAMLEESEELYGGLIENANDIIYAHDLEGNFISLNRAGEEITGYTREEAVRMKFADIVVPESMATVQRMMDRKRLHGGPTIYELEVKSRTGRRLTLEVSTRLIYRNGQPMGVQGVGRDITERKVAEEALRRSEENYRNIFDNATMGVYQSGANGKLLRANLTLARILGYSSADEVLNLDLADDIYLDRNDRVRLIEAHLATGSSIDLEVQWKRKDGTPIWIHLNSNAVRDEAGETLYFNGIADDITLRKQVEESLRMKTQQLEGITAALTASLEGKDWQGVATMLLRDALSQTKSEYGFAGVVVEGPALHLVAREGTAWHDAHDKDDRDPQARPYNDLSFNDFDNLFGEVITGGKAVLTNDGRRDPRAAKLPPGLPPLREFLGVPIIISGEVIGMIGVANHPTGYTDAERTRMEILAQMAGVLFENYRRLQRETALEEQLRQSQKIEAIGQLAGGVAHDFNNLLTAINGYSDLVMRRLDPDDILHRHVGEIRKAGDRAASLTSQLLAFSRKQVLQPKVLDLNAVVSDMDKMLRRLIGEDIDLLAVTDPSLGSVKADPGQIEQVILNLAVNARDAMPKGGKLTVETSNVFLSEKYARKHVAVKPGNYVMLAISDNGCGIDEKTQERIFEPFFTTKEQGKGTGLGLSTVYGIIKQSGGNVWVYSEVGKGTTFKVYLPRFDEELDIAEPSVVDEDLPRGTETVLLVEDDEMVRQMARQILEMYGYSVIEAENGLQALKLCSKQDIPIDIVVTDVVMPQMGGREMVERLLPLLPDAKVLYMSGYTDDAIVHHGVLDQSMHFLQKPFVPDALINKVREALDAE